MGLRVYIADADPDAPGRALADRFLHIDLKDEDKLAGAAETLISENLAGVFTAGTDFSTSVAYVAEHCSLPGISYKTAWDARDKGRMRRRFRDAGVPSPDFVCIESDTIRKIFEKPEDDGNKLMVTGEGKKLQFPWW